MQLTITSQNTLELLGYTVADFTGHLRRAKQLAASYDLATRMGYTAMAERNAAMHQAMIERLGYDPLSLSCHD